MRMIHMKDQPPVNLELCSGIDYYDGHNIKFSGTSIQWYFANQDTAKKVYNYLILEHSDAIDEYIN